MSKQEKAKSDKNKCANCKRRIWSGEDQTETSSGLFFCRNCTKDADKEEYQQMTITGLMILGFIVWVLGGHG